jgi:hypothetical protein
LTGFSWTGVRAVKEREVRSVLGLFDMAVQKHPATFYHGQGSFTVHALGRLLPLLASTRLRCGSPETAAHTCSGVGPLTARRGCGVACSTMAYDALMNTVFGLLSLLAAGHFTAYCLVLQGAVELLAGTPPVTPALRAHAHTHALFRYRVCRPPSRGESQSATSRKGRHRS